MRWLRPTVSHEDSEAQVDEIVAVLEAAAAEAPPSHRGDEIRAAVLEEVGSSATSAPGLAPLALAAGALLLALAIGIGAPVVGSLIGTLLERGEGPSDVIPPDAGPSESPEHDGVPMPSDPAIPTRELPEPSADPGSEAVVEPLEGAVPTPAPPVPQPAAAPTVGAAPTPTPSPVPWPPGQPPVPVPVPVPTPPATGPPPGTPPGTPGG